MMRPPLSKEEEKANPLSPELQKNVDVFLAWLISLEKKYYKNDFQPFVQRENQMKAKMQELVIAFTKRLTCAKKLLKDRFELQEQEHPGTFPEATFSIWEHAEAEIQEKYKKGTFSPVSFISLQDQMAIPWAWLDRAYQTACGLLYEKRYEEAQDIYFFLHHLQPMVFEYWLGEATCQHMLGKYKEAIDTYSMSLLLQPENGLVFFQMAECFSQNDEKESALKALASCLTRLEKDATQVALYNEALQLKKALELKQAM